VGKEQASREDERKGNDVGDQKGKLEHWKAGKPMKRWTVANRRRIGGMGSHRTWGR